MERHSDAEVAAKDTPASEEGAVDATTHVKTEEAPSSASSDGPEEEKQTDAEKGMAAKVDEKQEHPYGGRSKGKIAIIMLALCLAVFLAALDVTIITTALPTISEAFHSTAGYTWIGSAFLLANAASIPSWGKISDIFGRKPMLLVANVIFMIGSLIAALSVDIGMLIVARVIQGIGGGGLIILANIVIGDLIPLRSRGAFYGIIGGVWSIASSLGPILGGVFTEDVTWRWCFYINLPLDGIAFFILLFFLDIKTPRTPFVDGLKAVDWIGSITIVGGTLMFLFGLQYGGVSFPWDSATVICLLVFGVFTWAIFAFWEWKYAKYPIMPMGLFASVSRLATLAVVFFHGFVFISGSYYLPLYFQAVRGNKPLISGVHLLPTAISLAIAAIGTGIFVKKTGSFLWPIYFGMFMMTLGYGLFYDINATTSWGKIIGYQIIAGLGTGPIFQAPLIALQAHINPRDIGTATATLGFVRQLATSSSVVIGQVVFQNQMEKKAGELVKILGPQLAQRLGGANAGANAKLIDSLPTAEKDPVRVIFANSLDPMWAMYCGFAGAGLIVSFFIRKKVLSSQHQETKTGLDAERENAAARKAEREEKAAHKRQSQDKRHSEAFSPPRTPRTKAVAGDGDLAAADVDHSKKRALRPRVRTRSLPSAPQPPAKTRSLPLEVRPRPQTAARMRPADVRSPTSAQTQPPSFQTPVSPYAQSPEALGTPLTPRAYRPESWGSRPNSRHYPPEAWDNRWDSRNYQRPSRDYPPDVRESRRDSRDYRRQSGDYPTDSWTRPRDARDSRDYYQREYDTDRSEPRNRRYSDRMDRPRSGDYSRNAPRQSPVVSRRSQDYSHPSRKRRRRRSMPAATGPARRYSAALDGLYNGPPSGR